MPMQSDDIGPIQNFKVIEGVESTREFQKKSYLSSNSAIMLRLRRRRPSIRITAVISGSLHHHLWLDHYTLHRRLRRLSGTVPTRRLLSDGGERGSAWPRRGFGAGFIVSGGFARVNRGAFRGGGGEALRVF